MMDRVPPVMASIFPPDHIAPLAKNINREAQRLISQLRSPHIDLEEFARTIICLSSLSQEAEKC